MPEVATSPRSRASPRLETRREKGSTPNELNETMARALCVWVGLWEVLISALFRVTTKPPQFSCKLHVYGTHARSRAH